MTIKKIEANEDGFILNIIPRWKKDWVLLARLSNGKLKWFSFVYTKYALGVVLEVIDANEYIVRTLADTLNDIVTLHIDNSNNAYEISPEND